VLGCAADCILTDCTCCSMKTTMQFFMEGTRLCKVSVHSLLLSSIPAYVLVCLVCSAKISHEYFKYLSRASKVGHPLLYVYGAV
jgi:hypothetical protein